MLPALIHVGFPRTATTSLQNELTQNPGDALFLGRFTSRNSNGFRWGSEPLEMLMESINFAKEPLPGDVINKVHEDVVARATANGARWLIASDERICKPPKDRDPDWRSAQARGLKQLFPNGRILITIRRQADLLVSLYKRYLARETSQDAAMTYSDWLEEGGGSKYAPWRERFDLFAYYSAFADVFSPDNVHVLPFEIYRDDPEQLNTTFRHCSEGTNTQVRLGRVENQDTKFPKENVTLLGSISDDLQLEIDNVFAVSNRALVEATNLPLSNLGYLR